MSLFVVVIAVAMMLMIGLIVDGGRKVRAIQRADAVAAEAARAGGQAIVAGPAIRGEGVRADTAPARRAAEAYLTSAGVSGTVTVAGGQLTVTTSVGYKPVFLGLIGVGSLTGDGHSTVRLVRGLDGVIP